MESAMQPGAEVEADVECLMCARVIGRLSGHKWTGISDRGVPRTIASMTMYRDNDPRALPRRVRTSERFRCRHCGGQGFIGEISVRAKADKLPAHMCPIHADRRTGPGRRPKGCRCEPMRFAA